VDALIFDFDGVIVDSEPLHLAAFQEVLAGRGVDLGEATYYERYIGYDDHDCFVAVSEDYEADWDEPTIAALTAEKTLIVQRMIRDGLRALPGAVELVQAAAAADVPVAICSGALGDEVRLASRAIGIDGMVAVIVAAEDVKRGKPDPEGYLKAARLLAQHAGVEVTPGRCVVCEDSPAGIAAGKTAGMAVVGLRTTCDEAHLGEADSIVDNLASVTLDELRAMAGA
jgi:beta-phosphoglucomutase